MTIVKSRIFEVFESGHAKKQVLYTKNLSVGKSVYGERLVRQDDVEYREWLPERSKLASAIFKGCPSICIRQGNTVLYLGAATGTTVSHVSDIVGSSGFVFALDFAPTVVRELYFLCLDRTNIAPILADANQPMAYRGNMCQVDVVYQDIAQKNQIEVLAKNCDMFLKKGGYALIAVKARSIDVTKKPKDIFRACKQQLEKMFAVIDYRELDPFQKDHCFFILKKIA
jgi:fibrillarin-like pre-rRNA processing protein